MHRRRIFNCNLNTINISYKRKLDPNHFHHYIHHKHANTQIGNHPPITPQPQPNRVYHDRPAGQPQMIHYSHNNSPDKYDSSFNDTNLKYEKSQTEKESYFNRLRVHIYRKEKRSKWVDLAASINSSINQQIQKYALSEEPHQIRKQNKTAVRRKRQTVIDNHPRIKTLSPEEDKITKSSRAGQRLTSTLQPQKDLQHNEQEIATRLTRLDELFQDMNLNPEQKPKPYPTYKKYRNLSDNTTQLQKRLAKLDLQKMRLPNKLRPVNKQGKKEINTIDNQSILSKDFGFEAWEDVDIFSTNRNGIVEYIKQQQIDQNNEKKVDVRRSKMNDKNKRVFNH